MDWPKNYLILNLWREAGQGVQWGILYKAIFDAITVNCAKWNARRTFEGITAKCNIYLTQLSLRPVLALAQPPAPAAAL